MAQATLARVPAQRRQAEHVLSMRVGIQRQIGVQFVHAAGAVGERAGQRDLAVRAARQVFGPIVAVRADVHRDQLPAVLDRYSIHAAKYMPTVQR
jgi:hypothetical protein